MKERILSRWSLIRILWLLMGIGISIQAVSEKNFLMLLPALYFVLGAIANIGCFAGTCATRFAANDASRNVESTSDIQYEEVSSKH